MKHCLAPFAFAALAFGLSAAAFAQRPMTPDDVGALARVQSPEISPDGAWVAYTVSTVDKVKDRNVTMLWMVSWVGTKQIQLTQGPQSASSPKWSPDGRYLSFTRSGTGDDDEGDQIWLMDRRGGEARQLTDIRGDLEDYAWAPDSKRLALVLREEEPKSAEEQKTEKDDGEDDEERPKPIVIDRFQFKSDEDGYHYRTEQPRIFLYDIESKALTALTGVKTYAESDPAWSADGKRIAFISNRDEDWDRTENPDIWVTEARAGAPLTRVTTFEGSDEGPLAWSPDGRRITYTQGSEPKYWLYDYHQLALVNADGSGNVQLPTSGLDRDIQPPQFSVDGRSLLFLVTDNRVQYLARIPSGGGAVQRLTTGANVVEAITSTTRGPERVAVQRSTSESPSEIYAFEQGRLRQLTHHNAQWVKALRLGATEDFGFRGKDGTEVFGLITRPPSWEPGRKYPAVLWIHGGPYGQDEHSFDVEQQLFAAQGYVVVQVNYRGSAGRGTAFGRGIFGNWGSHDVDDLLAGVDHVVGLGFVDAERLALGGWSQGGIMTDFLIARDQRFKAAISGAGASNQISLYGADQYVYSYELEFGRPWENVERWMKISYPFFHADQIRTPTLFLGGDKDFNVPIAGTEQMYQILRSRKVPTQLIIYPGEHHGISRPSFVRDRYERYVAWYAKYLK